MNASKHPQSLEQLLADHPLPVDISAEEVRNAIEASNYNPILVVLDDDPTGTQSVTDLPVLTQWTDADFEWAFESGAAAVYVMTNSRSLDPEDAAHINREVARAARRVADKIGCDVEFVSRSDSTLRGHFPLEPKVLIEESDEDQKPSAVIVIPAFGDAGRITVGGIHYAGNPESGYLPVGETEFAQDATFGYHASHLGEWIEEKTEGRVSSTDVAHLPLDLIRSTPQQIAEALLNTDSGAYITADIVTETDLRMLALGIHASTAQGKRFLYRVGPPFTRALIGQDVAQPLSKQQIEAVSSTSDAHGGLIVVGSHVPTTTRQLNKVLEADLATVVEMDVTTLLAHPENVETELVERVAEALSTGNVIFHTSRKLVKGDTPEESLRIARTVSDALVSVCNRVTRQVKPRFVIAKGGITSSDVARKGLEMTRATVVGPLEPGIISMWKPVNGLAHGIPYIVFAGNVGNDESLLNVVIKLSA